jgi:iron(III) transport system permease protein
VTDIARNRPLPAHAVESRWLPSSQGIVTAAILIFCGGLVAYPLVYLVAESLNVSGEDAFPPAEIGFGNYTDLVDDWHVLANTAFVACLATVMAIVIGFLAAWTLTAQSCPDGRNSNA